MWAVTVISNCHTVVKPCTKQLTSYIFTGDGIGTAMAAVRLKTLCLRVIIRQWDIAGKIQHSDEKCYSMKGHLL